MRTFFGFSNIPSHGFRRPVVALGVFDGLHQAHRTILRACVSHARRISGTSIVVTFFPHPKNKQSIHALSQRLGLIAELGVNACVLIRFNQRFARMSAEDFVRIVLVKKMKVSSVYIGKNFRFGRHARGDVHLLERLGKEHGFSVRVFNIISRGSVPVSSTRVRSLIARGNITDAATLLKRPVSIYGRVARGDALGRELGFPTANLMPEHDIIPPHGIYAAHIVVNGIMHNGVCYIGKRPTILKARSLRKSVSIEAHIFDYRRALYGKYIEVMLLKKLRNDAAFSSLQDLSAAIRNDVAEARKFLRSTH